MSTVSGTACLYGCGFETAHGLELVQHEREQHSDCPLCQAEAPPMRGGTALPVEHERGCPLAPPRRRK